MNARAAVHQLLSSDAMLATLGVEGVFAANSADSEDVAGLGCFLVVRWEDSLRAFGTRAQVPLVVWAHDHGRDYGQRIQPALERVKDLLGGAVHLAGADGFTLTLAEWQGDSGDLFDDGYNTITRYSTFGAVSRRS